MAAFISCPKLIVPMMSTNRSPPNKLLKTASGSTTPWPSSPPPALPADAPNSLYFLRVAGSAKVVYATAMRLKFSSACGSFGFLSG